MSRLSATVTALILGLLALIPVQPATAAAGESFIDRFDGALDTGRWYVSDGWNNGDHQNCQFNRNNVRVEGGALTITFDDKAYGERDYSCAEVQSRARLGYGTFETRMKAGKGSGLNSAFFSYIGPVHDQPWDEIDFEVLGKDTTKVEVNSWVNGTSSGGFPVALPADSASTYVDFAYVWEPGRLRFFVNGTLVKTLTGGQVPTHEQILFAQIWGSDTLTGWMGPFTYPGHPVEASYDHIAYTKLGDPCQFTGSVACSVTTSFVDDFDTLDTSRWYVSDGWNNGAQQNCTWARDQVSAAGGMLNLSFTKKAAGDRQYACAEVQTRQRLGHGTYEARLKGVAGSGLMSAMFTYVTGEAIDIKVMGRDPGKVKLVAWDDRTPLGETLVPIPEGFVDVGMVWSESKIDYYVNGTKVHSITDAARLPELDANLFLNVWGSDTLTEHMGPFEDPGRTLTFQVDRVAYTAPGDPCPFTGSIACA
ncbi:family 16 glycosylhydrolase [Nonomuraea sp. B1E8]|uniref:family 16 glycosylhydrolase n=1 Tax=unclassified Nonomuraea TaxID=2593643 RepID=UPI00325D13BB